MGIRILVLLVIATVLAMNICTSAAWPAVAAISNWMSEPVVAGQADSKSPPHNGSFQWGPKLENRTYDWTLLSLTIQWPQSFCLDYNDTHTGSDKCVVPPTIKQWTIHGLWPSYSDSEGPINCNESWTFDRKNISDIESELEKCWPSYILTKPSYLFWQHEWEKHGTCAASLPALYGELNYFSKTLELYKQFDVYSILKSGGVIPDWKMHYSYKQILHAVTDSVGKRPSITCSYDKKRKTTFLSEIDFCLDKQFNLIDCNSSKSKPNTEVETWAGNTGPDMLRNEDCSHDKFIFYPPMNGL